MLVASADRELNDTRSEQNLINFYSSQNCIPQTAVSPLWDLPYKGKTAVGGMRLWLELKINHNFKCKYSIMMCDPSKWIWVQGSVWSTQSSWWQVRSFCDCSNIALFLLTRVKSKMSLFEKVLFFCYNARFGSSNLAILTPNCQFTLCTKRTKLKLSEARLNRSFWKSSWRILTL